MAEPQQQNPTEGINPENNHMAGDPIVNNRPRNNNNNNTNNNNNNANQQQPVRYKTNKTVLTFFRINDLLSYF